MPEKPVMLIVDDSEVSRRSLKRVFWGEYEFIEAKNGEEAIQILKKERFISIVLLDAIMPKINGFQMLERMQEDSDLFGIPVVMVTQQDDEYTEIKALELGAADFIAKPYKSQIIRRRVKNIVVKNEIEFRLKCRYDKLTGIYTRDTFCEATSQMLRENTHKTYVIVRWNVERFKMINDLFGIREGDRILVGMAKSLVEAVDGIGTYGRLGADHFVMCIPYNLLDIEDLMKQTKDGFKHYKKDYAVVSNYGIYVVEDITIPVDIMCDRAGMALEKSKGNFIKPYAFYKEKYRSNLLKEQRLIKDMNAAIAEGQFEVYYQPIFSLSLGEPISTEALVRWNHPTKRIVPAGQFIPVFESNGFIRQLDAFVLDTVCKQLKMWKDNGEEFLPVSVNVSTVNIYEPNLCNVIIGMVEKYNIEPSMLQFEITERAYTENVIQNLNTIKNLRQYGFSILMGDFGSGHSAFNILREVPVDVLKIDLRFLEGFAKSGRIGSILASMMRMARWLNMPVIAVGVETQDQVDFLRSVGCDMMQGYYFSRPLTKEQLESFMKKPYGVVKEEKIEEFIDFIELFNTNFVYNQIFNSIIDGIGIYALVDDNLEAIRVNDGYYKIMGYTHQTFIEDADRVLCRVVEEDRARIIGMCRDICKSKGMSDKGMSEMLIRRYDMEGNLLWLEVNVRFLGGNPSRPLFCLAFKDVTAQKTVERKALNTTQRLKEILSVQPLGIGIFKCCGKVEPIYISASMYGIFGLNYEEFFEYINNEVSRGFLTQLGKKLKKELKENPQTKEMPFEENFVTVKKDGSTISIKVEGVVCNVICSNGENNCICYCTITEVTPIIGFEV